MLIASLFYVHTCVSYPSEVLSDRRTTCGSWAVVEHMDCRLASTGRAWTTV